MRRNPELAWALLAFTGAMLADYDWRGYLVLALVGIVAAVAVIREAGER